MGTFGPIHWLILLVVVLLVFGTGKLRNIGSDLGAAVKGFKQGMRDEDAEKAKEQQALSSNQTIEGEAHEKKS